MTDVKKGQRQSHRHTEHGERGSHIYIWIYSTIFCLRKEGKRSE